MMQPRRRRWLASLALVPGFLLAACSGPETKAPTLDSITVSPTSVSLLVGGTRRVVTTGIYSDGSFLPVTSGVTYSSTAAAVATVSADGLVAAVAPGSASIIASASGHTATVAVTVTATTPILASIAVTPATVPLLVGATAPLSVVATFSDGSTAALASGVTFSSSAASVATVSAAGVVTAVAAGSAVVTATSGGKTATATVTVTAPVATLTSIGVAPATATLLVGATRQLTVTGTFSFGPTQDLTGSSTYATSDATVATVSAGGLVTAVKAGTATITATSSGKTATAAITVSTSAPTLTSIAVTPATLSLAVGGTPVQLTVTGTFSDASTADVTSASTFSASPVGVANVAAGGLVTATGVGTATITATDGALTATATVTVTAITTTGGQVFVNGFDPGVSFAGFGGATNDVTEDVATVNNGHSSLKIVAPAGGFTGGALVASVPRDLRAFNAVTFWAKASTANTLNVAGLGDNAATNPPPFKAEALNFAFTGTFQKFVIPLPDPTKLVGSDGLFHFADGGKPAGYTFWLNDIQYENLPPAQVGTPTGATGNFPAVAVAVGATSQIDPAPNTVSFLTPVIPTGGSLKNVSWRWYTLTSSAPAVATVDATGLVSGVSGGTANVTATLTGLAVPGTSVVTVTAPLAVPATIATAPTVPAANVISLFSSAYTNHGVDTWQAGFSTCCNDLVDPFVIPGTTHDVKKYTLRHFVGVEFGTAVPANTVDASAMTTFHMDVWSPNPPAKLQIQLVNNPAGPGTIVASVDNAGIAANGWVPLEIPLTSFAPALTSKNQLQQMLILALDAGGAPSNSVVYVDNIYFHN